MQVSAGVPSEAMQLKQPAEVQDRGSQAFLPAHSLPAHQPAIGAAEPAMQAAMPASPEQSRASAQQAILDNIKATLQVSHIW